MRIVRKRRRAVPLALGLLVLATACQTQRELDPEPPRPRPQAGMVVSEAPLASQVGAKILRDGGNAVDAAVATALALSVVLPQAGNLGGGGFALYVPHEGEPQALDFRERAPSSADPARYLGADGKPIPEMSLAGPWSVAVPGSPAGLYELYERFGSKRFTFEALCKPAVELARKGFLVDAALEHDLAEEDLRKRLEASPGARATFVPDGTQLRKGQRLVQPELASTLEELGKSGPASFYHGRIARQIVAELQLLADVNGAPGGAEVGARGLVGEFDLNSYDAKWRAPLRGWFRGMEVITMPPPSSGGVALLETLAVLDGFPIEAERRALPAADAAAGLLPERAVHWWIEALRRAFAERAAHLGDPDFVEVPLERLLSPEWVARARVSIGETAAPEGGAQAPAREGGETTHLSVLDQDGNAVSLTTTLNSTFGSGILVRGAGFLLNDEIDDFALAPGVANQFGLVGSEANALQPGKRPLSSMAPTVLRRGGGSVALVIGSPGGPRIITSVIAVIVRTLLFDEPLAVAVEAPRFHQQWSPSDTEFEPG
ncbi:MAG TPA: gamma-glutamyltransferase, partial [Planctomycetota bacterium]|nr:gamma-glutamyltransferase [Planctomycetota bacterium]